MDTPTIDSPEALQKAMADLTTAVQSKADATAIEAALEPVNKALAAQRKEIEATARAARDRATASGKDADVTRAYVPREIEQSTISKRMVVENPGALSVKRGSVYLGNGDGVIKMLGHVDDCGDYEPGLLDDPIARSDWHREMQDIVGDVGLCRSLGVRPTKSMKRLNKHMLRGPEPIAKVWADNAGEGGEFIADVLVPDMLRELRLPTGGVADLFMTQQLRTGGVTENPFHTAGLQPFLVGNPTLGDMDPATIERSVQSTDSRTVTPKTWAVNVPSFMDAEEDSIVEWGLMVRNDIIEALRDGEEDAIINGDTGTHGDTAIATWAGPNSRWGVLGSNNDHRTGFVGLRHRALGISGASADESGAQTATGTILWRSNLATAHKRPRDLVYIVSLDYLTAKLLTDSTFLTVDKYGPQATIYSGEVGQIGGVPVVVSEYMTSDLNASGVYDGVTTDYTGGLVVNRMRFQRAIRRGPMMALESRPTQHTNYLVASSRWTFRTIDAASTKNLYYAIKLAK